MAAQTYFVPATPTKTDPLAQYWVSNGAQLKPGYMRGNPKALPTAQVKLGGMQQWAIRRKPVTGLLRDYTPGAP